MVTWSFLSFAVCPKRHSKSLLVKFKPAKRLPTLVILEVGLCDRSRNLRPASRSGLDLVQVPYLSDVTYFPSVVVLCGKLCRTGSCTVEQLLGTAHDWCVV